MGQETIFKLAFLGLFVSLAAVRVWFQRQAGAYRDGAGKHARRHLEHEARLLRLLRPLLGLPFYAVLLGWLFSAEWMRWSMLALPPGLRAGGIVLAIVALALLWSSHLALGKNFCPTLEMRPDHELVTQGPYRWMRHPMYMAFLLMLAATGLLAANWFLGLVGVLLIVSVMFVRAPEEERRLRERFGARYEEYARHTGRFVPLVGR